MTKRNYEYVQSLKTENLYKLEEYNGNLYDRYYFDMKTETLYLFTRHKYKLIKPKPYGMSSVVNLIDVNHKHHLVSYPKFVEEFRKLNEKPYWQDARAKSPEVQGTEEHHEN